MRRRLASGLLASAALAMAYAAIVRMASGSTEHLLSQIRSDWFLLIPIVLGFGIQVALFLELRRRQRVHRSGMAAASAATGTSAAGMLACCAHHIADLAPFLGLSAAAPFLLRYRIAFMLVGLTINAVGIGVAARRLRRLPTVDRIEEVEVLCASR